jgi:hypothetical protein
VQKKEMVNKVKKLPRKVLPISSRVGQVNKKDTQEQECNMHKISPAKQERINNILLEMKCSTDRIEHLLAIFNRINRGI